MYQRSGLDRHIFDFKSKLPQDNEKKLRCFNFAKLHFMNKDYKSALKSINEYLSVKEQNAAAHKLLGQIYEALDENPKALEAYKRCYHLDKKEMGLLPEICRLMVLTQADNESKRQWLAKAEKVFPYHEEVGKLRQSMLENREDSLSETLKDISNCSIQNIDLSSLNISSPAHGNLSAIVASPLKLETQIKSIARTQEQIIRRLVETQEALVQTNERLTAAIGENNDLIQNVAKQVKELSDSVAQIHSTQKELKENFDAFTQGDNGDDDDDDEEYSDNEDDYYNNENDHNQDQGGASSNKNAPGNIFSRLGGFGQSTDNSNAKSSAPSTGSFGNQFAPPTDSWECGICYVQNIGKKEKCVACESPSPFQNTVLAPASVQFGNPSNATPFKPQAPPAVAKPLSEMFKLVQGTWECQGCCLQNNPNVNICPSCETPKPGYQPPPAVQQQPPKFTFGTLGQTAQPSLNQSTQQPQQQPQQQPKQFLPQPTQPASQSFPQFTQQTPPAPVTNAFGSPATQPFSFSFNLTAQKALSPPNNSAPTTNANQTTPVKSTFSFGLSQQSQSPSAPAPFNAMMNKPPAAPFTFEKLGFSTPSSVAPSIFQPNPPSIVQANEPNPLQMLQKQVENQPVVQTSATFMPPIIANPPSSSAVSSAAPLNPNTFTGFSFNQNTNSSPLNVPNAGLFAPKVESSAKPTTSNQVFGFGSSGKFDFNFNPVTPTVNTSNKTENENKSETKVDGGESDGEVENNADDIHFQPVIPLPPKVEVRTGEEGEDVIFSHRARLFRYDNGDWKERGTGDIKVLYEPTSNRYRLLMRREQIHKVCLNHQIMADFVFFEKSANNRALKDLQWAATDFSDGEATPLVFTIRFKDSDIRNRFMDTVTSVVDKIKNSTSGQSNSKSNSDRQDSNSAQDDDIQLLFVKQPSEDLRAKARELRLPENFYNYESQPDCKGCPGCNDEMPTLKFEADGINVLQAIRQSDSSSVSTVGGDSEPKSAPTSQPVFGTLFSGFNSTATAPFSAAAGGNLFSAAIDEQGAKSGGWNLSKAGQNKWNTGKIQPIFGSTTSDNNDSTANDDDPEAEANVDFKPIIPLPELVEIKTGEEDETVLFTNRAKLYRFDKGNWKERGVGDFRVLKNESTGQVRFLMRREQIHKVCLNHLLTKDLEIELRTGSDRIFQWNAVDFSEGTGTPEVLALRFGNSELAKTFLAAINKAKSEM